MIRSMTGYGKVERQLEGDILSLEIRSVNSRYLDMVLKMPEQLEWLASDIKRQIGSKITRGRLEVTVSLNGGSVIKKKVNLNRELFQHYQQLLTEAAQLLNSDEPIRLEQMLNFRDIFVPESDEFNKELIARQLSEAVEAAVSELITMQVREGEFLAGEIITHLNLIEEKLERIKLLSKAVKDGYIEKCRAKLKLFLEDIEIDDNRILQEAVLYAKKVDISEECERLSSHIEQLRLYLNSAGEVGKRIDFLAQEMNREIGTIGAKSENAELAHLVVEIKSEIDKIREQAQNIL
jgi:uncharacterized protein (TIGR00255 family)